LTRIHEVLVWPDPRLTRKAEPVTVVDDALRELVDDMFATMYHAKGVGLAAPQIGVSKRVVVIDLGREVPAGSDDEKELRAMGFDGPLAVINPEFIHKQGTIIWEEGCLSVPGITAEVKRAAEVKVRCLDRDGQERIVEARDLFAVALQHENDHLEGVVFVDYLSRLKRDIVRRKMTKILSGEVEAPVDRGTVI
jgi:peptide deformylase